MIEKRLRGKRKDEQCRPWQPSVNYQCLNGLVNVSKLLTHVVRPARSSVCDSQWGWRPDFIKTECTPWNVNHYVPWAFRSLPAKTTFQQTTEQPSILDQHQSAQGKPKKEHYRIIDFGKELNHDFGQLESSTAVDYRAMVKKKFLASFRWSWFRLGTIILAARIVVELQISFPHISYSIISRKVLLSIPNEAASHRIGYQFEAPGTVYGRTYSENFFLFPCGTCLSCASDSWMTHSHSFASPSLSADQCTHPGGCWQCLRNRQGNPSRILNPYIPL